MKELYWKNKQLQSLSNEIWINAYGYDDIYSVSNLGRIRSEQRYVNAPQGERLVRERILAQVLFKDRLTVSLSMNNILQIAQVNQLIYYSFNPHKLPNKETSEVFHKNKIGYDNRLINLSHNDIKGKSYKISIALGNVKHLEEACRKLQPYSYETAIIKNGKTTHRKCKECKTLKTQEAFEDYGRNTCKECRALQKKQYYNLKLKKENKQKITIKPPTPPSPRGHRWRQ